MKHALVIRSAAPRPPKTAAPKFKGTRIGRAKAQGKRLLRKYRDNLTGARVRRHWRGLDQARTNQTATLARLKKQPGTRVRGVQKGPDGKVLPDLETSQKLLRKGNSLEAARDITRLRTATAAIPVATWGIVGAELVRRRVVDGKQRSFEVPVTDDHFAFAMRLRNGLLVERNPIARGYALIDPKSG